MASRAASASRVYRRQRGLVRSNRRKLSESRMEVSGDGLERLASCDNVALDEIRNSRNILVAFYLPGRAGGRQHTFVPETVMRRRAREHQESTSLVKVLTLERSLRNRWISSPIRLIKPGGRSALRS